MKSEFSKKEMAPLKSIEDWEDDLIARYPKPKSTTKKKEEYRNYKDSERVSTVKEFYRLNHTYQTYEFVENKEKEFLKFDKREMSFWDAIDFLIGG